MYTCTERERERESTKCTPVLSERERESTKCTHVLSDREKVKSVQRERRESRSESSFISLVIRVSSLQLLWRERS